MTNDLDKFEAMRQAAVLAKHQSGDPAAVPARFALELATSGGEDALGLGSLIGSLEAGKGANLGADLMVASMGRSRHGPEYDPVSHVVCVTHGDDGQAGVVKREYSHARSHDALDRGAVLAEEVRAAVRRCECTADA